MSDEEMEAEAPATDPGAGLATALIVITTLMLVLAWVATQKTAGDRYNVGPFAKSS